MYLSEIETTPEMLTREFGANLGTQHWTVDEAATHLAVTMHGIRANTEPIAKKCYRTCGRIWIE